MDKNQNYLIIIGVLILGIILYQGGFFSIFGPDEDVIRHYGGYNEQSTCGSFPPSSSNPVTIGTNIFNSFSQSTQAQVYPLHNPGEPGCGDLYSCPTLETCQSIGYAQGTCDFYCPITFTFDGTQYSTQYQYDVTNGGVFSFKNGQIIYHIPKIGASDVSGIGHTCSSSYPTPGSCVNLEWEIEPNVNMYFQNPETSLEIGEEYTPILVIDDTFGFGDKARLTIQKIPGEQTMEDITLINGLNTINLDPIVYNSDGTKAIKAILTLKVEDRQCNPNYPNLACSQLKTYYFDNLIQPEMVINVLPPGCTSNTQCPVNSECINGECIEIILPTPTANQTTSTPTANQTTSTPTANQTTSTPTAVECNNNNDCLEDFECSEENICVWIGDNTIIQTTTTTGITSTGELIINEEIEEEQGMSSLLIILGIIVIGGIFYFIFSKK